ncbi:MAG: alpha/beta hydrolase family protein [Bacteroidia bacterium]
MKLSLLSFLFIFISGALFSQNEVNKILGDWQGDLEVQGTKLKVVFHLQADKKGVLSATMDSPEQNSFGNPADKVSFENGHLKIVVQKIMAKYEGDYQVASDNLTGNFFQGTASFPLNLMRSVQKIEKPKRSQEVKPPFPYKTEEVSIENAADKLTLSGTLTLPKGKAPFPVAILVSGSGPQNRDEELLGHKPFAVIADDFARKGIATLRYDDRGVGKSKGDFATATSEDFAKDALAVVEFLSKHKKIDVKKIGIIGHSEGGMVAPMVASKSKDVAFIVLMAGPGISGGEILALQARLISEAEGTNSESLEKELRSQKMCLDLVKNQSNTELLKKELAQFLQTEYEALSEEEKAKDKDFVKNIPQTVGAFCSPWMQYFIRYNPQPVLEKVSCAVLAINGEKDLQVPYRENLAGIEAALKKGGNKNFKVQSFPNMNHLFQTTETGKVSEYVKIEETINPKVLNTMSDWILSLGKQ